MDIAALLSTLRERDVRLWVEEDKLKCNAPEGALDAEMRATLATHKPEIIAFLRHAEALKTLPPGIVPLKSGGRRPPLFVVSGHGGDVFYMLGLARQLHPEQPVFGVQPAGLDGSEPARSVEELARYEIEQIRRYCPEGPYWIAGHCAGGTLAFEIAHQLTAAGEEIALLAMIGSPFPTMFRHIPQLLLRLGRHAKALTSGPLSQRREYFMSRLRKRLGVPGLVQENPEPTMNGIGLREALGETAAVQAIRHRVEDATMAAMRAYKPRFYAGHIELFATSETWHCPDKWRAVAASLSEHRIGEFGIDDLLLGPHVGLLAAPVQQALDRARLSAPVEPPSRLQKPLRPIGEGSMPEAKPGLAALSS